MAARILIVDDEDALRRNVSEFLTLKGYECETARDGMTALAALADGAFSLCVLDVGLPDLDGFEVCRRLRERGIDCGVLMLTARDEVDDRVKGLESGADDYLVKPFSLRELAARIQALLRRAGGSVTGELKAGPVTLDLASGTATREGREIRLTPTQFKILKTLMKAAPSVVSRATLEREIWGDDIPDSDSLRTAVWGLRNVLDKPFAEKLIGTKPGFGWCFNSKEK
jgi:DNA-binding response OmpR family regulator